MGVHLGRSAQEREKCWSLGSERQPEVSATVSSALTLVHGSQGFWADGLILSQEVLGPVCS